MVIVGHRESHGLFPSVAIGLLADVMETCA